MLLDIKRKGRLDMLFKARASLMISWFNAKGYSGTLMDMLHEYFQNQSGLAVGTLYDHINKSINGTGNARQNLDAFFKESTGIDYPRDAERAFFENTDYSFQPLLAQDGNYLKFQDGTIMFG